MHTGLSFLFAVCKSFYLQCAKVFIDSVQKFLFAVCTNFYLQCVMQDYYYDILIVYIKSGLFAAFPSLHPGLNEHIYLVKSIPMRSYLALNRSIRSEISLRNSNGSKLVFWRCSL